MVTSVLERLLYIEESDGSYTRPPRPTIDLMDTLQPFRNELLQQNCSGLRPVSRSEFAQMFSGRKRTIYENAVVSLMKKPVDRRDAYVRQFIKLEKVKRDKRRAPRNISPRNPRYNVEVGKYLKPVEHRIYNDVARVFGEKVIFKGMNVFQQGSLMYRKWSRFQDPVAIGLDAKRFDQCVSQDALKFEHSIYLDYYDWDETLKELLSWQLTNKFIGGCDEGRVLVEEVIGRMSGDMNTALGNCVIMCAMIYCYMKSLGYGPADYALCNNGDDVVLIFERNHLKKVTDGVDDYFISLGFRMEVEDPVYTLEHIEFCQMKPVHTSSIPHEGWRMVRDFLPALAKDRVSLKRLDTKEVFEKWISSVGECGLAITSGIPVVQNMYRSWIVSEKRIKDDMAQDTGFFHLGRGVKNNGYVEPSDEARVSFYLAFGIAPDHQRELERIHDNYTPEYGAPYPKLFSTYAFA